MASSSYPTTLTPDISHLKSGEVNLGVSYRPLPPSSRSNQPKRANTRYTQTSIMAVAFNGGVVVGADSRTTTGAYIANRVTDKLTYLHERVYCCRSGSAADTQVRWLVSPRRRRRSGGLKREADAVLQQAIADVAMSQLQLYAMSHMERPSVAVAATLLEGLCYSNKCVPGSPLEAVC